ncbi:MAG: hypothetical protein Q8N42_00135, partial [bacterium]|nr:hypothetical protein [bacterium]
SKNLSSAEATTLYFNNTSGDNTSSELQFQIDNTPKWTLGMDYQNADYVLAYDFSIHGDVLRLSPGGNMILGAVIGSPSAQNSIFTIQEPSNRGGLLILSATSTIPAITVEPLGLVKDALQIYKSNDTDRGYINWYQPSAGYGWRLGMLSNPYDFAIYQYTGFSNSPATPGTDVFHITSGGNIGMGTTSPLARLDVAGANNGTAPLFQLSSVASYATTTQFMVTNLGKVGIGTSNPLSKLHLIVGNSDGIAVAQSAFPTVYQFFGGIDASGSGQLTLKTAGASQNVQLLASGVSYLNGGNVGIGTTSPQALLTVGSSTPAYLAASEKYNSLFVSGLMEVGGSGTSTIANNLYVAGTLRSTASYIGDLFFANQFSITESSLDNPIQELIFKNQKGEEILKLDENGNLTIKGSINNTPTENSSFGIFGDIVQLIKDGLSKLTGVIQVAGEWVFDKIRANTIETQNIQTENGITTKDETSGDYYCIKVKDGQVTSQKGKCGDQNLQNAELPSLSPSSSSDESSSTPPVGASTSSESSTLQGESSE